MSLRTLARGKPCYARFPGHCTHNPEQTVLAHLRIGGLGGVGLKPSDLCGLPVCAACHDVIDMRVKTQHSRAQVYADCLRGLCQWLSYLEREGYLQETV